jgi:hypothetical protein
VFFQFQNRLKEKKRKEKRIRRRELEQEGKAADKENNRSSRTCLPPVFEASNLCQAK